MDQPPDGMQICPSRPDGRPALFAHAITPEQCHERQEAHYHKCPRCIHAGLRIKVLMPQPPPLKHPSGVLPLRAPAAKS